jgi:hypothetical protein
MILHQQNHVDDLPRRPNWCSAASSVVALRPLVANTTNRPSFHYSGTADHHSACEAHIIPLQGRRFASRPQPVAMMLSATRRSTETVPRHPGDFATSEKNYHNWMFANLAAAAWIGTLFMAAYYVFSTLLASS